MVRSVLATRYTSEEIVQRLGITPEKRKASTAPRDEELARRAGNFWGRLSGLFKR